MPAAPRNARGSRPILDISTPDVGTRTRIDSVILVKYMGSLPGLWRTPESMPINLDTRATRARTRMRVILALALVGLALAPLAVPTAAATSCVDDLGGLGCAVVFAAL